MAILKAVKDFVDEGTGVYLDGLKIDFKKSVADRESMEMKIKHHQEWNWW